MGLIAIVWEGLYRSKSSGTINRRMELHSDFLRPVCVDLWARSHANILQIDKGEPYVQ